jgi:NADPH2 dehydrogenase
MSNNRTVVLHDRNGIGRLAVIARHIKDCGSLAGIQLAFAPPDLSPPRLWYSKNPVEEIARLRRLVGNLDATDLKDCLRQFVTSARLAVEAGFDFIQVHAAHGYLLSLLLNDEINFRTDDYSSDGIWFSSFMQDLRKSVPCLLGIRMNVFSGILSEDDEFIGAKRIVARLVDTRVNVISLSGGIYTLDKRMIYPSASDVTPYLDAARLLAQEYPDQIFGFAGGVKSLSIIAGAVPDNMLIELGRPFIADPEYARKYKARRANEINWCARANHCHYFSIDAPHIRCGVNPNLLGE